MDGAAVQRESSLRNEEHDLIILHTPHSSTDLGAVAASEIPVLDTRGLLHGKNVHSL